MAEIGWGKVINGRAGRVTAHVGAHEVGRFVIRRLGAGRGAPYMLRFERRTTDATTRFALSMAESVRSVGEAKALAAEWAARFELARERA